MSPSATVSFTIYPFPSPPVKVSTPNQLEQILWFSIPAAIMIIAFIVIISIVIAHVAQTYMKHRHQRYPLFDDEDGLDIFN